MTFRKGDDETAYRNSDESYRKLSFVNPASDGNHVPYNKRFAPKDSWAQFELSCHRNGGLSVYASEGHTRADGGSHSKMVSLDFSKERAIELRDFLNKQYPVEG